MLRPITRMLLVLISMLSLGIICQAATEGKGEESHMKKRILEVDYDEAWLVIFSIPHDADTALFDVKGLPNDGLILMGRPLDEEEVAELRTIFGNPKNFTGGTEEWRACRFALVFYSKNKPVLQLFPNLLGRDIGCIPASSISGRGMTDQCLVALFQFYVARLPGIDCAGFSPSIPPLIRRTQKDDNQEPIELDGIKAVLATGGITEKPIQFAVKGDKFPAALKKLEVIVGKKMPVIPKGSEDVGQPITLDVEMSPAAVLLWIIDLSGGSAEIKDNRISVCFQEGDSVFPKHPVGKPQPGGAAPSQGAHAIKMAGSKTETKSKPDKEESPTPPPTMKAEE